jgi:hypothetical protein
MNIAVRTGVLAALLVAEAALAAPAKGPLFGFTYFPYDITPDAVEGTYRIVNDNSTLAALHLDNGIPWAEIIADKPLPKKVQQEWEGWRAKIPSGRPVYLGLAPLAKDRKSLAPSFEGKPLPSQLKGLRLDDAKVKAAYVKYARRAIEFFKPQFVNLGIEAGEIITREPSRWPQLVALFDHTRTELKRDYPDLPMGISFGLQGLREPRHAQKARELVDKSDYLCVSFYPHLSKFGEVFGDPPLKPGRDAWIEPLNFMRQYTDKPLAICETGLSTRDVDMKQYKLFMNGFSSQMQAQYVKDLGALARRDRYLFVVWFLAIDYDRLFEKIPRDDANLMWRNAGLLDGDARAKPALEEWKRALHEGAAEAVGELEAPAPVSRAPAPAPAAAPAGGQALGFSAEAELFECGPGGSVSLTDSGPITGVRAMRWDIRYKGKDWMWCYRAVEPGALADARSLLFSIRSDKDGPVIVQLEENSGETFFARVDAGRDWTAVDLDLSSLTADPKKKKNGMLETADVKGILIADPAGTEGAKGKRAISIADLRTAQATARTQAAKEQTGKPPIARVGFAQDEELPQCGPGSNASLGDGPKAGVKSLRWDIQYKGRDWMWCYRNVEPGSLARAQSLALWMRSDKEGPVIIQLEEASGETFFAQVNAGSEWTRSTLVLSELTPDPAKRKDGKLDRGDIKGILMADPMGTAGSKGKRVIWAAEMIAE